MVVTTVMTTETKGSIYSVPGTSLNHLPQGLTHFIPTKYLVRQINYMLILEMRQIKYMMLVIKVAQVSKLGNSRT